MTVNEKYTSRVRSIGERFYEAMSGSGLAEQKYLSSLKQTLDKEVFSLLNSPKPRIMVYGIYNSGKSTLVNAIMGKAVAEVADRPMTWKIAEYDTGSYVLIDSPGVDAPKEHEQIADSKLRECHVILFVISSKGGFESEANYRKMCELIRLNIPFYIVLNDRGYALAENASEEEKKRAQVKHAEELENIRRKILINLEKFSGDPAIGGRYVVIQLNARRAWLGVEKNNPKLFEKSGVRDLENRIGSILNGQGALEWLRTPQNHLMKALEEAENALLSRKNDNDYVAERHIMQQKRQAAEESLKGRIQQLIGSKRDAAYRMQLGGIDGLPGMLEDLELDVKNACLEQLLPLAKYVDERFRELGVAVDNNFSLNYSTPKFEALGALSPSPQPDMNIGGSAGSAGASESGSGLGGALVKTAAGALIGNAAAPALGTAAASGLTAAGIGSGLSAAGLGTLLGGPAGAIIGGAIGLISSIISSSSKQREAEEARRQQLEAEVSAHNARIQQMVTEQTLHRQEARNRANRWLDELENKLRPAASENLNRAFGQIIAVLNRAIDEHTQLDNSVRALIAKLRQLRAELDDLRVETA
ncbi:50S ribosome-binding GTPase [bacterium]|nr:50S ribosome-binding GTPase [bacterium]